MGKGLMKKRFREVPPGDGAILKLFLRLKGLALAE